MLTPRFIEACSVSVALHAGMLGLPSGSLDAQSHGYGKAAPRIDVLMVAPATSTEHAPNKAAATAGTDFPPAVRGKAGTAAAEARSGSDAEGFGIPGPRYYAPGEVSVRARAISDVASLPPKLEHMRDSGRMVLVLRISSAGRVDDVDIAQSDLPPPAATELAAQFRQLRFHPAEIDGVAVNSRMKVEVILAARSATRDPSAEEK